MRIVKTVVKSFNPALLSEELAGNSVTSGITTIAYQGFDQVSEREQAPKASREEYGSRTSGGVRTPLLADPGEIHLEAPADPGAALDTILAGHVFTDRSSGQTEKDDIETDRATVSAGLRSGPDLTPAELKAMGRVTLDN